MISRFIPVELTKEQWRQAWKRISQMKIEDPESRGALKTTIEESKGEFLLMLPEEIADEIRDKVKI